MAIKRCKASFAASVRGVPRVMKVGALVNDDDPILKGRAHLFEDVDAFVQERAARVEEATAVPGRRRSLGRSAAKRTVSKQTAAKPKQADKDNKSAAPQDPAAGTVEQEGTGAS